MISLFTSTLASLGISRPLQTLVPRTSLFPVGTRASVSMGPIGVDNSREPLSKAIGSMIMIGAREGPNHDRDWEGFNEKKVQPTGAGAKALPSAYKVIRLHDVPSLETRKRLMAQVHDVLRQNYGSYADSEPAVQWLDNLAKSGLNSADPLCKLLVTMVVDANGGGALGFSSAEVFPAGDRRYIYNAYTCVRHGAVASTDEEDEAVIRILKQDIALCAKELRDVLARDNVHVQASFQDHMLYQPSHVPKIRVGFSLGQVPLGALGFTNYQLPIYSCEVASAVAGAAPGTVDPELLASKKLSGTRADLFLADLAPSDPRMPFSQMLREFAAGYVRAHSVYSPVMTDDPAFRAMVAFADSLPQEGDDAMYDKIHARAKLGARQYCAQSGLSLV